MANIPNPTPGTVLQQGVPRVPGTVPATGNPGLAFNLAHPNLAPPGTTVGPNGAIIANDTSFAGPGDTVVQMPDGSKTVLMKNGAVVTVPGAPAAPEGGGGGGGHKPPPLKLPPPPVPQAIPGPKAVGASKLGAPNQTWDWLLEALAAPGLLSPMMQNLGFALAQPATSNDFLPQVSQPNFGGLFGTPTSPAPFLQQQQPSFVSSIFGNTPWQGQQMGGPMANMNFGTMPSSGNVNLGAMPPRGIPMGSPVSGLNFGNVNAGSLSSLIGQGPAGGPMSRK